MKRIVCDIDGVLAEFNRPFRDLLISCGATMKEAGPDFPELWEWPLKHGATSAQLTAAWDYVERNPDWWASLPRHADVTDWTASALQTLTEDHEVTFVTSRPGLCRDVTADWLMEQFDIIPHVVVCFGQKEDVVLGMRPDVIIEDRFATIYMLSRHAIRPRLILVNRPYNHEPTPQPLIERVGSTLEALNAATRQ
jgi:uncharacterized HAD superfamily protein